MLKQINIQDLQPGMVIVRIVEQNGPVKIKKSGLVTSQNMVQGLVEMGIQQLEVDPDQTVEVEAPHIKKSATRRILENNTVTSTRIEDGLSEQFHRSLFLPSAQNIPSAWQFYTKRYSLAAFIALGGLSLGWTLANYQGISTLLSPRVVTPVATVVMPAPDMGMLAIGNKQRDDEIKTSVNTGEAQDISTGEPQDISTDVNVKSSVQQVAVTDEIEQSAKQGPKLSPELSELSQTNTQSPEPKSKPQISADVLARFRKAMNEVEDLPVTSSPVENISSSEDVPRIDQLPAWVMNRLPGMAFSAHMYASIDSERWVRVNGVRMVEGNKIDGIIEIIRIEPQHVILNYSGQMFSMAALTDW
jgi:general secretion pathway protein B